MKRCDYEHRDAKTRATAHFVVDWIRHRYQGIESIVDFGCGVGTWLKAARDLGCKGPMIGIDGPWVPKELRVCNGDFMERDFESEGFPAVDKFDLAICLEVAEHLPERLADSIMESVTSASDLILWGAGPPGIGGDGHRNEKWPTWWDAKFLARGFGVNEAIRWVLWCQSGPPIWYRQDIMIYEKGRDLDGPPLDAIHPEIWSRLHKKIKALENKPDRFARMVAEIPN